MSELFFHFRATGIFFTILGGCRHLATSSHKFPRVATSSDKLRQVPTSCDKFRQVATVTELRSKNPQILTPKPPQSIRFEISNLKLNIFKFSMSESSDIFFSVLRGPKLIGNVVPEYRHVLWSMDKYRQSMDKYRRVQTRTDTDRTLIHKLSKFSSKTTYPSPSNHQIDISRKINVRANFFMSEPPEYFLRY